MAENGLNPEAQAMRTSESVRANFVTETLGGVNYHTFKETISANEKTIQSSKVGANLPEIKVPLSIDKDVLAAHDSLMNVVNREVSNPAERDRFRQNLDTFERRASEEGLSAKQVTETYGQLRRMTENAPSSPFSHQERNQVAEQWATRLADPTTAKQGWHDTCGWTVEEMELLTRRPEKITAKMAEVMSTGTVSTVDMASYYQMAAKDVKPGTIPTKTLVLDAGSLRPDQEAQGLSAHADRREYADQIAQVMEDSIAWDSNVWSPNEKQVSPGTMQYRQCETIKRPGDALPERPVEDKSCESVAFTDPETGKRMIADGEGFGFGGAAKTSDLARVNWILTGNYHAVTLLRPVPGVDSDPDFELEVHSPDELKDKLEKMQQGGRFPFSAQVEMANPGIREDYLARHPEKTGDQVPTNSWHFVALRGMAENGDIQIYNPYGLNRTWSLQELYNAMGKPNE